MTTTRQAALRYIGACRKLALKKGGKARIPSYHEAIEQVQKAQAKLLEPKKESK